MDPIKQNNEQAETREYEAPKVTDYGTLQELTEVGGSLANADVPLGHINSAFPAS
jgi:hypothetical protein